MARVQGIVMESQQPAPEDPGSEAPGPSPMLPNSGESVGETAVAADASLTDEELDRVVEACLFATTESLTVARMAAAAGGAAPARIRQAIARLRSDYAKSRRAFEILEIAGGFRLYSRPEYQKYVVRLQKGKQADRLSAAALETLAIIAYRQPLIRAEVDAIRGVQSSAILRSLLDKKLIRLVGRSDQPGRPLLYGTSKRFLDHFGLSSVKDLPKVDELKAT